MTPENDRLAVIIVSHNSAGWLAPCLSSVYAKSGNLDVDVVVVDSGSTDDTVDLVRREFPDVRVLTTENRGFAAANNRGLEVVDAEWVLFLNPDTRILSGTLEELVSSASSTPGGGTRGSQAGRRKRCDGPDDTTISERRPHSFREPRRRATSVSRLVARRTRARRCTL